MMRRLSGRSLGVAALACISVLVGCGDDEGSSGASSTRTAPIDSAFPRDVKHQSGTATIAKRPKRIVETGSGALDLLLSLDVAPVQVNIQKNAGFQPFQQAAFDRLGVKPQVVKAPETTLQVETVATARPDLIVSAAYYTDTVRDELEGAAPVLDVFDAAQGGWRANLKMIADALGIPAKADDLIAKTDETLTDALAGRDVSGKTFAYIFNDQVGGAFSVCNDPLYGPVELLTKIGLSMTPEVRKLRAEPCAEVSTEQIPATLKSTDFIVISELYDGNASKRFLSNSVVANLPAIKQKRYHVVEGPGGANSAMDGFSPLGLDTVLPELKAIGEKISQTG